MIGVYFSGTGNTAYCVKRFLKEFENEEVFSIEDPDVVDKIQQDDIIVFGYPIYYSSLPKIVYDFITNNKEVFKGKEIYVICTMGLFSGDGTGCAARLFKEAQADIAGGLILKMPDCIADEKLLKRGLQKNKELVSAATQKIVEAADCWKKGKPKKEGLGFGSHMLGLFGQRLWFGSKTKKYSKQLHIHADRCIGCGICARDCPMNNIHLQAGKAQASDRCTMCYRCINRCPQQAITLLGTSVVEQWNMQDLETDEGHRKE